MPGSSTQIMQEQRPAYRPDIDGLRAVAVFLVLLEHLRLPVPGGYVGVDVFFVISGYLIGAMILAGLRKGTFSITEFYERRILRILPAFVVMLLGTSVLATVYFTPPELADFAGSMLAALFSVSNFLFWHQAGYFDLQNAAKPLLHTWSLAVEEQFYLLFPPLLMGVRRWLPGRMREAIWTLTALSIGLSLVWVRRDPTGAYFFAPVRAWELLAGTIVSQGYVRWPRGAFGRNAAALAGLGLIVGSALLYSTQTPFPGLAAMPPCVGAALLIAAGETGLSLVGRLLSLRPVVFLGLISYSLYLWHWPMIVFQHSANMLHVKPGVHGVALMLLMLSIALAVLSWRFVEQPFRSGRLRLPRRTLFRDAGLTVAAVAALAVGMMASRGLAFRYPPPARAVADYLNYSENAPYRQDVCFLVGPGSSFASFRPAVCLPEGPGPGRTLLLLGDSHAAALYAGLRQVYPERVLAQANAAGCRPLLPAAGSHDADATCAALLQFVFQDYLPQHPGEIVLLAGRWKPDDLDGLLATVRWLRTGGLEPVVFGPATEYDAPLPRILANALEARTPEAVAQHEDPSTRTLDREMAAALKQDGTAYVSMYDDLCSLPTLCPAYAGPGIPLMFDTDHLTEQGSVLFARAVRARNQLP
jgi:peptidoglycan/LPS O-acetylase OafA/YrhL